MTQARTDRSYEAELRELRERLLFMAGRVEQMIASSVGAFVNRDLVLAETTIEADHQVNLDEIEADDHCLRILAKRQPMASDLRFITLALKMVTDLERISDLAVNICERAIDLGAETDVERFDGIAQMGETVRSMVHDAIEAFVTDDPHEARAVIDRDDEVDDLYDLVFRDILYVMMENPNAVHRGIHLLSVAKYLERMADHATNLAEQVVFMVKGKDIRHLGKRGES